MQEIIDKIDQALSLDELEKIRVELFGKKGIITSEFAKLKDIPSDEK
ncbi:hypothetical protein [Campylobacter fetus]|nr:hypothetical protein [Campylobacter fetus]